MIAFIFVCVTIMTVCIVFGASVLGYVLFDDWRDRKERKDIGYVQRSFGASDLRYNPLEVDEDIFITTRNDD